MASQGRLPPVSPDRLNPDQKRLFDDLVASMGKNLDDKHTFITRNKEGAFLGPWNALLHAPNIGYPTWQLTKAMAKEEKLPQKVRQVVILTVGAHFKAAYEIYAHIGLARQHFSEEQVQALAGGELPVGLASDEQLAWTIAKRLVQGGPLPDDLWAGGVETFGQDKTMEIVFLVSHYASVSMRLNGFNVTVPSEEDQYDS